MKKWIIVAIMLTMTVAPALALGPVLQAQSVHQTDVKILFSDTEGKGFTEKSYILPQDQWMKGNLREQTTTVEMIKQGWTLQNVVSLNANQYLVVFVK